MGNFCSGKQAKKEAKLEEIDKPGDRGDEVEVAVSLDGVNVEVKDTGVGSDLVEEGKVKAEDGMRVVKDRAKEIAKEAEAKALSRKLAAEKAAIKAEDDARKSFQQAEESAAQAAEEAAGSARQAAEQKTQAVTAEAEKTAAEASKKPIEVAAAAQQAVHETADTIAQKFEQTQKQVVAEVEATKETAQNVADSLIAQAKTAAIEAETKATEMVQAMSETVSDSTQSVSAKVCGAAQAAEKKVGEAKIEMAAVTDEAKQIAENATNTAQDEAIKASLAAKLEADAAVSQAQEKTEEIEQAAAVTVQSAQSQAVNAMENAGQQTGAAVQCAEDLADKSQRQTEEVKTSVVEQAEDSAAASKEYIVATVQQDSSKMEQAAREALQIVGRKMETRDYVIEKGQEELSGKAYQAKQTAEDSLTAISQKVASTGEMLAKTAVNLTQELTHKATDKVQEAAEITQSGAEAATHKANSALEEADQASSQLENLTEEQSKRVSSGAEAESAPAVLEKLMEAGSALVQQEVHTGLQTLISKGEDLRGSMVDKLSEAVGGADGGAGEGGFDSSQNNATSFQPLSPGASQDVNSEQRSSDINLELVMPGSGGDILLGESHVQVERKEEELPPSMRETCVRQTSLQDGEISPSDEVCYGDEGPLPPPPADFGEGACIEGLSPPESADGIPDEETLQRVAAQVTNQAVQEAIRLFTENGLGGITPTSDLNSSPSEPLSSPGNPSKNLLDFNDEEASSLPTPISQSLPLVPSPPSPLSPINSPPPTADPLPSPKATEGVALEAPPASGDGINSGKLMDSSNGPSEALI